MSAKRKSGKNIPGAKAAPPADKAQPAGTAADIKKQGQESAGSEISRRTIYFMMLGFAALVLLVAMIVAADNRKDWTASINHYSLAQVQIGEGDYAKGLETLQGLSESYQASSSAQLLMGTCYAGMAEEAKAAEQTQEAQADMQLAAQHLDRARAANFQLVQSQGYVNGYGKIMLELGRYEVAQQYFLQSVALNTYPELTEFAQENIETIKTLTEGGTANE
ncbi:MAG: hypothetical protein Q4B48_00435 [Syntrophomonadaceae bacterium]|nr:hypothetical protein [Syntrophomonadaceae bacterium]